MDYHINKINEHESLYLSERLSKIKGQLEEKTEALKNIEKCISRYRETIFKRLNEQDALLDARDYRESKDAKLDQHARKNFHRETNSDYKTYVIPTQINFRRQIQCISESEITEYNNIINDIKNLKLNANIDAKEFIDVSAQKFINQRDC